jgi:thioredoxin reductase (NADPH)
LAEKVAVIGSGPAGLTAAIYLSRASLPPVCFEGFIEGGVAGGQLMTTTEVENFPGFPEGIQGPELMTRMRSQAEKFGTKFISEDIIELDLKTYPFVIQGSSAVVEAQSVVVATGATAKKLNLPSEQRLWNRGISACAVCDGGLPAFRNQRLVVAGGGDTAMEEAMYLTHFASEVCLVHRRDSFRASKAMQEKVFENSKIRIIWDTVLEDAAGEDRLEAVLMKNVKTGEISTLEAKGLFYAIGHKPNTSFLKDQIDMDEDGYILTKPGTARTNIEGVFAAGDVQDKHYRQAITAAGSGCMAALECERWLCGKGVK